MRDFLCFSLIHLGIIELAIGRNKYVFDYTKRRTSRYALILNILELRIISILRMRQLLPIELSKLQLLQLERLLLQLQERRQR